MNKKMPSAPAADNRHACAITQRRGGTQFLSGYSKLLLIRCRLATTPMKKHCSVPGPALIKIMLQQSYHLTKYLTHPPSAAAEA
jgi:hypothetical protein